MDFGYTADIMKKAWDELRVGNDGRIARHKEEMETAVKAVEEQVQVVQQEASALNLHFADMKKAWDKLSVGNDGRRIARYSEEEMEAVIAFEELVDVVHQATSALRLRVNEDVIQVVQQAVSALLRVSEEMVEVVQQVVSALKLSVADLTNSLEELKVEREETRIPHEQEVGTLVASAPNVQGQLKVSKAHAQQTREELLQQANVLKAHTQQTREELLQQANVLKAHVQQMGEKVLEQLEGPEAQLQLMREDLERTKETEDRSFLREHLANNEECRDVLTGTDESEADSIRLVDKLQAT